MLCIFLCHLINNFIRGRFLSGKHFFKSIYFRMNLIALFWFITYHSQVLPLWHLLLRLPTGPWLPLPCKGRGGHNRVHSRLMTELQVDSTLEWIPSMPVKPKPQGSIELPLVVFTSSLLIDQQDISLQYCISVYTLIEHTVVLKIL